MFRSLKILLTVAACIPAFAFSLGMGELQVKSALNQKLSVDIPLVGTKSIPFSQVTVYFDIPQEFARSGVQLFFDKEAFLSQDSKLDKGKIHVYSHDVIKEPYFSFIVHMDWPEGRLVRTYTVLLDPSVSDSKPSARRSQMTDDTPSTPTYHKQGKVPLSNNNRHYRYAWFGPIESNESLWTIASELQDEHASLTVQQIMASIFLFNQNAFTRHNLNGLMHGVRLKIPELKKGALLSALNAELLVSKHNRYWSKGLVIPVNEHWLAVAANATGKGDSVSAAHQAPRQKAAGHLRLRSAAAVTNDVYRARPKQDKTNHQLALSREALETASRNNEDLRSRLNRLEEQAAAMQNLLKLKDEEVKTLTKQLAESKQLMQAEQPALVRAPDAQAMQQAKVKKDLQAMKGKVISEEQKLLAALKGLQEKEHALEKMDSELGLMAAQKKSLTKEQADQLGALGLTVESSSTPPSGTPTAVEPSPTPPAGTPAAVELTPSNSPTNEVEKTKAAVENMFSGMMSQSEPAAKPLEKPAMQATTTLAPTSSPAAPAPQPAAKKSFLAGLLADSSLLLFGAGGIAAFIIVLVFIRKKLNAAAIERQARERQMAQAQFENVSMAPDTSQTPSATGVEISHGFGAAAPAKAESAQTSPEPISHEADAARAKEAFGESTLSHQPSHKNTPSTSTAKGDDLTFSLGEETLEAPQFDLSNDTAHSASTQETSLDLSSTTATDASSQAPASSVNNEVALDSSSTPASDEATIDLSSTSASDEATLDLSSTPTSDSEVTLDSSSTPASDEATLDLSSTTDSEPTLDLSNAPTSDELTLDASTKATGESSIETTLSLTPDDTADELSAAEELTLDDSTSQAATPSTTHHATTDDKPVNELTLDLEKVDVSKEPASELSLASSAEFSDNLADEPTLDPSSAKLEETPVSKEEGFMADDASKKTATEQDDIFDEESGLMAEIDEVSIKMDLAKAYLDLNDKEGAKEILGEILEEGDDSQRKEAETLMAQCQE